MLPRLHYIRAILGTHHSIFPWLWLDDKFYAHSPAPRKNELFEQKICAFILRFMIYIFNFLHQMRGLHNRGTILITHLFNIWKPSRWQTQSIWEHKTLYQKILSQTKILCNSLIHWKVNLCNLWQNRRLHEIWATITMSAFSHCVQLKVNT